MSLDHEAQLRQIAGAEGINRMMVARGWPDDGMVSAVPSQVLGNVTISYYDGHGRAQNVECVGVKLMQWLLNERGRSRAELFAILERKRQKDAQA